MSAADHPGGALLRELRYALAEADSDAPPDHLRDRVLAAAMSARLPGPAIGSPELIPGAEVFRRSVAMMGDLLKELSREEWSLPALRGLTVQGLIGHLIGVEDEFIIALTPPDEAREATDHVATTQPIALSQQDRPFESTYRDWSVRVGRTSSLLDERDDHAVPATWFGITLPLEQLLLVRAFEMWIHHEDIRRATGRPLTAPDPASLARMAELAVNLIPVGMGRAGSQRANDAVRLVLTGAGGGTWIVSLDGQVSYPSPVPAGDDRPHTRIVVDTAAFCRVVGNRDDLTGSGAIVDGDLALATDLFRGAATLALD